MDSHLGWTVLVACFCQLSFKGCYATVYCEDQNGIIQYSCEDTAYCCGIDECCLLDNGFNILTLWYFWASIGLGFIICIMVSRMFCKSKRHSHVQDISRRTNHDQANDVPRLLQPQLQTPLQPLPRPQPVSQTQPQQVVVIPVVYNQPPMRVPQEGVFNISGSVLPMVPMGTTAHPGMHQQQGRRRVMMMHPRPPPGAEQRQAGAGEFGRPLGPGYQQPPPAYAPLPPGYVPPN
ncbi:tyrosine-protein phosphatase non-receptor type 23-like [Patiria miniata]|uniref:Vesicular, overexpressed in cancer, prosurvival protein 1 n=1 Tax=Patiria miniata TaxID=46514 RepID=A0A914BN39_PATMI|nr:tyrosine-protein phosphatase non-receptor type 23-like [Patiria miniata]